MKMPDARTLPGLMDEMAARYPGREFVVYNDERLTFAQFRERTREVAKSFHALGVREGDTVALLMGNQTEWLLIAFAVAMLRARLLSVNTWWQARELQHALGHAEADTLVMVDRYLRQDYVETLGEVGDLKTALPHLKRIVCLGDGATSSMLTYDAFLAGAQDVPDAVIDAAQATVEPEDIVFLLYTSGSSAFPKAVPIAHRGMVENMHGIGERMYLTEADRFHMVISLFWGLGCMNALFAIMTHGACIVLQHNFDAGEALELMERERCTGTYAMANMALALFNHPDRKTRDLSSLRTGLTLAESVDQMVEIGAREVVSVYGLTESYGNSTVCDGRDPVEYKRRTAGPALPGTEIVIADPQTHTPLPQGETGEVKIRGYIISEYWRDPESTAKSFDAEGFLLTGDLGRLDERGYLEFRGRLKEMIKSGGMNVSPAEVEVVLREHSAVDQAIVVGIPDPARDEILAAAIVLKPGKSVTAGELEAYCRAEMARYKVPARFDFLRSDEVPLTDTGKVSKRALQDRFQAAAAETG
ncbi:MAG TPA: AMP-binding protein [Alphaproteobacteria bacterium]|nr:AMP-binding protein [Alphaproteobacteria bacterium]